MKRGISWALIGLENLSVEFSSLLSKKGKKTQLQVMPLHKNSSIFK